MELVYPVDRKVSWIDGSAHLMIFSAILTADGFPVLCSGIATPHSDTTRQNALHGATVKVANKKFLGQYMYAKELVFVAEGLRLFEVFNNIMERPLYRNNLYLFT